MFGSDCMKRMICCLFLIVNVGMYAQSPAKYWIAFTDKNNNGYSVDQPEAFLSKRALEKRKRFHIEITTQDLPLTKSYVNELLAMDTSMRLLSQSKWLNGISVYSQDENLIKKLDKRIYVNSINAISYHTQFFQDIFFYLTERSATKIIFAVMYAKS